MTYDSFKETIKNSILDHLPAYYREAQMKIGSNSNKRDYICFRFDYEYISPVVYIDKFYMALTSGEDIETILSDLACAIKNAYDEMYCTYYGTRYRTKDVERCIGVSVFSLGLLNYHSISQLVAMVGCSEWDLSDELSKGGFAFVSKDKIGYNFIELPQDLNELKRLVRSMSPLEVFVRELERCGCKFKIEFT